MQVLFCHAPKKFVSRLISRITGEDVTHVALLYKNWVVHANQRGLNVETFEAFGRVSSVVRSIEIKDDEARLFNFLAKYEHAGYDIGALLYFGVYYLLAAVGLPRAAWNLWNSRGRFTCVEWASMFVLGRELSLMTPGEFYALLKSKGFKDGGYPDKSR